jgi:hypothetical protein
VKEWVVATAVFIFVLSFGLGLRVKHRWLIDILFLLAALAAAYVGHYFAHEVAWESVVGVK